MITTNHIAELWNVMNERRQALGLSPSSFYYRLEEWSIQTNVVGVTTNYDFVSVTNYVTNDWSVLMAIGGINRGGGGAYEGPLSGLVDQLLNADNLDRLSFYFVNRTQGPTWADFRKFDTNLNIWTDDMEWDLDELAIYVSNTYDSIDEVFVDLNFRTVIDVETNMTLDSFSYIAGTQFNALGVGTIVLEEDFTIPWTSLWQDDDHTNSWMFSNSTAKVTAFHSLDSSAPIVSVTLFGENDNGTTTSESFNLPYGQTQDLVNIYVKDLVMNINSGSPGSNDQVHIFYDQVQYTVVSDSSSGGFPSANMMNMWHRLLDAMRWLRIKNYSPGGKTNTTWTANSETNRRYNSLSQYDTSWALAQTKAAGTTTLSIQDAIPHMYTRGNYNIGLFPSSFGAQIHNRFAYVESYALKTGRQHTVSMHVLVSDPPAATTVVFDDNGLSLSNTVWNMVQSPTNLVQTNYFISEAFGDTNLTVPVWADAPAAVHGETSTKGFELGGVRLIQNFESDTNFTVTPQ